MGDAERHSFRYNVTVVAVPNGTTPGRTASGKKRRSSKSSKRLAPVKVERGALACVLDHFPIGVAVLHRDGRVLELNFQARRIFDQKDGLYYTKGELSAGRAEANNHLRQIIREVSSGGEDGCCIHRTLKVSRLSERRPYELLLVGLRSRSSKVDGRCEVGVFIRDPDHTHQPNTAVLRELFGLTAAEARFAHELLNCCTLEGAADSLRIGLSTARTHLKKIFAKTDTNRQVELVRLLLSGIASVDVNGKPAG